MTREKAIKIIKEFINGTCLHLVDQEALETLIPELKESEDERIRKWILEKVQGYADSGIPCPDEIQMANKAIAYLEKQKDFQAKVEQRMEYLWDKLPDAHRVEESNCTPEEWKALGAYIELEMNFDKGSEEEQKEQKSNLCDECKKKSTCLDTKYGDDRVVEQCINFVKMEQKSVWSEEDSDNLERIDNYLWMLDDYVGDDCAMPQGKTDKIRENIQEILLPWIKSLPKRFNFQPKQEWSESDKQNINLIISYLDSYIKEHNDTFGADECKYLKYWLKSFPLNLKKKNEDVTKLCSNEWSEEDERMRCNILNALTPNIVYTTGSGTRTGTSTYKYDKEINWLKSLCPQYHGDVTMTEAYKMGKEAGEASHWKPSEHQMTILKAVKDYVGVGSGYWGEALGSLIEDLEKL